jgi:hypothetical protein
MQPYLILLRILIQSSLAINQASSFVSLLAVAMPNLLEELLSREHDN